MFQYNLGEVGLLEMIIFVIIYICCVCHAMWTDAFEMTISNWVSIILLSSFGLFAALNLGFQPTIIHVSIGCAVFAVTFSCYAMRWMGGGDVKFLSALSAWMGPQQILPFLTDVALLGGLLALGTLVVQRYVDRWAWTHRFSIIRDVAYRTKSGKIPYAVPIGCAALISCNAVFPILTS